MRVELALIVGILFFCCWCAYIIVRMNSSVSTNSPIDSNTNHLQPLASDATFARINNGSDISSYLYRHNQQVGLNQTPMLSIMGRDQQMQLRQQNSNSPHASYVRQEESTHQPITTTGGIRYLAQPSTSNIHHQISSLRHSKPPYSAQTNSWTTSTTAQPSVNRYLDHLQPSNSPQISPKNNWPNQYYQNNPAQNSWRPQVTTQNYYRRPSNNYATLRHGMTQIPANNNLYQPNPWRPATINQDLYAKQRQRSSIDYPESDSSTTDKQATNDSDVDPDPDADATKASGGDQGEEEQPAPSNETGASTEEDQQQQQPELNKEIEEQNGQRSYSEDESDANERDRDGNILVNHHNHLINGRPIEKGGGNKVRKSAKGKNKNAEFDKIANEIEGENQSAPDYDYGPNGQQETDESRERKKVVEPSSLGLVDLDGPIIRPNKKINLPKFESKLDHAQQHPVNRNLPQSISSNRIRSGDRSGHKNANKRVKSSMDSEVDGKADPLPKKGRESHEHKLKESLTAQHWDDDTSSTANNKDTRGNKLDISIKKLPKEDEEQLESSSSTDGSDNAQESSLGDSNKNEQDVNTKEEMEAEGETGPQQVEAEFKDLDLIGDPERFMHSDRRKKRQADDSANPEMDQATFNHFKTDNVSQLSNNSEVSPNQVDFDDTDTANITDLSIQLPRVDTILDQHKQPNKDEEIVSGQENINHEMALSPPMINENYSDEHQSNQAIAIDLLPPPVDINNQNNLPPQGGPDTHSTFYENLQGPAGIVNYRAKSQDRYPSPDTFYQNGHSSGPYSVPPPEYHRDNQEIQQQQHQSDNYPNDGDRSQLTQLQPSTGPTSLAPLQDYAGFKNQHLDDYTIDQSVATNYPQMGDKLSDAIDYNPLASGSKSKSKKVKKKFKKSKLSESKRKAALSHAMKKNSKSKKGRLDHQ